MKIVHVITGLRKAAGTTAFAAEAANTQARIGHEVTVAICHPDDKDLWPLDSRVKLDSIDNVVARIREKGKAAFDVMHLHCLWDLPLHRAHRAARKAGIVTVRSPHGTITPWSLKYKWWKKWSALALYQWWDLRGETVIHCTADAEVADVRRLGLKNRCFVVPLGVNLPTIDVMACKSKNPDRIRTILFVSRVQKKKGVINLVEAWARVKTAGWQVIIAGPNQEGHADEVMKRAKELGVEDTVKYVGPVYGEDKDRLYASADLFALPTYSENFGIVVIDSLAGATPVITTKGAPWKILADRGCGWWIDIGVDPLVAALREAMSLSDEELGEMGRKGRALVEEKYTWDAISRTLVEEYSKLIK